jgi:hypothetical protein
VSVTVKQSKYIEFLRSNLGANRIVTVILEFAGLANSNATLTSSSLPSGCSWYSGGSPVATLTGIQNGPNEVQIQLPETLSTTVQGGAVLESITVNDGSDHSVTIVLNIEHYIPNRELVAKKLTTKERNWLLPVPNIYSDYLIDGEGSVTLPTVLRNVSTTNGINRTFNSSTATWATLTNVPVGKYAVTATFIGQVANSQQFSPGSSRRVEVKVLDGSNTVATGDGHYSAGSDVAIDAVSGYVDVTTSQNMTVVVKTNLGTDWGNVTLVELVAEPIEKTLSITN